MKIQEAKIGQEVVINLPRNIGEIKKMNQMYLIASAYLRV